MQVDNGRVRVHLVGGRAYPELIKLRVLIACMFEGYTREQACNLHGCASIASISRWKRKFINGLSLKNPKPGPEVGIKFKICSSDLEVLRQCKTWFPDFMLHETINFMAACGCEVEELSVQDISKGLKFLGFTRKVVDRHDYRADDTEKLLYFIMPSPYGIWNVDRTKIIDVDELGISLVNVNRRYGHSARGEIAHETGHTHGAKKYTVIVAANYEGVVCSFIADIPGITNEIFLEFIQEMMVPAIAAKQIEGAVITMDNLRAHRQPAVRAVLHEAGHEVVYRPKYSPQLAFIELVNVEIKSFLRRFRYYVDADSLVYYIMAAVTKVGSCVNYMRHCGL